MAAEGADYSLNAGCFISVPYPRTGVTDDVEILLRPVNIAKVKLENTQGHTLGPEALDV